MKMSASNTHPSKTGENLSFFNKENNENCTFLFDHLFIIINVTNRLEFSVWQSYLSPFHSLTAYHSSYLEEIDQMPIFVSRIFFLVIP